MSMEKLSGLVLDMYDDSNGEVLRSIFPIREGVSDLVKTARFVSQEEREELPDGVFALVLTGGEAPLRKYACVDAGNTALSVEYFLREGHKLPEEAQKVAAANLVTACHWYGLPPNRMLEKAAFGKALVDTVKGVGSAIVNNPTKALGTAATGMFALGTANEVRDNLRNLPQTARMYGV